MKVLFLSLSDYRTISEPGLYTDLLRCFIRHGDEVFMISPAERKKEKKTCLIRETGCTILKLPMGTMKKTNRIEKGISLMTIEPLFIGGIQNYFSDITFDLVLYPTPPITFCKVVEYIKRRDGAKTYLLLKDIFPQNAVDMGMMSKSGIKGILYQYFRRKEKRLYEISDCIGCMSEANVKYLLEHNPEVARRNEEAKRKTGHSMVEVCPNSYDPVDRSVAVSEREEIRKKYGIPQDRTIFVYGGNLGKPQGIDFFIRCVKSQKDRKEAFFLVIGSGTEYGKLKRFAEACKQENFKLMEGLPREDYDAMVGACDVGLIFLDHRFTIPNFPSRLLSYMQAKLPVLAVTDPNTDMGKVIVENGFGWWCESDEVAGFEEKMGEILEERERYGSMGERGMQYFIRNYSTEKSYEIIMSFFVKVSRRG